MKKLSLVILFFLFLAIHLYPSLVKPFNSKGEAREALSAQYMLEHGDYLLALRYGEELQTKPPMAHWLMVASSVFTGGKITEFSTRLPNLLCSLLVIFLIYFFVCKEYSEELGFYSALSLTIMPEWLRASQTGRVDMVLSCFIIIALLSAYYWQKSNFSNVKTAIIFILSLSAACLSKGPIGIFLPVAVVFIFIVFQQRKIPFIKLSLVLALSLVLPAIWYISGYLSYGDRFLAMIGIENLERLVSSMPGSNPHTHDLFYLPLTFLVGTLPFSFYFLIKRSSETLNQNKQVKIFLLITFSFIFVFFLIPASKRSTYLLPIYPFAAIYIAAILLEIRNRASFRMLSKIWLIFVSSVSVLLMLIPFISKSFILSFTEKERKIAEIGHYLDLISSFQNILILCCLTYLIITIGILIRYKNTLDIKHFFISYCLALFVATNLILPYVATATTTKYLAEQLSPALQEKTYTYNFRDYITNFYLKNKISGVIYKNEVLKEGLYIVHHLDLSLFLNSSEDFSINLIDSYYYSYKSGSKQYDLYKVY